MPRKFVTHAIALAILIGGCLVSRLLAEGVTSPADALAAPSLLEQWLKPDVVIGGVLVLLYVGELRGDLKRMKADQSALAARLHDDYMPRREVEAMFGRRHSDH